MGKAGYIIGIVFFGLLVIALGVNAGISDYIYDKNIGNYFDLAVQSSTATQKLDYLNTFDQQLVANQLTTGYGALIFTKPSNDASQQYKILKTIEERLIALSKLNTSDLAYQQGLYELGRGELANGQNSNTFGIIDVGVFEDRYFIEHNIFAYGGMWFSLIMLLTLIIMVLFAVMLIKDDF